LERRERRRRSQGSREFPELTAIADIKLKRATFIATSQKTGYVDHTGHFPDAVAKPSVEHFQPDALFKKGFDLMIRYSYYRGTNYRTNLSAPTQLLSSLEKEYREPQDLRERVREAEAAAAKRLACLRLVVVAFSQSPITIDDNDGTDRSVDDANAAEMNAQLW
jgi:hypothetical protein